MTFAGNVTIETALQLDFLPFEETKSHNINHSTQICWTIDVKFSAFCIVVPSYFNCSSPLESAYICTTFLLTHLCLVWLCNKYWMGSDTSLHIWMFEGKKEFFVCLDLSCLSLGVKKNASSMAIYYFSFLVIKNQFIRLF